jgi:hypothetical protein
LASRQVLAARANAEFVSISTRKQSDSKRLKALVSAGVMFISLSIRRADLQTVTDSDGAHIGKRTSFAAAKPVVVSYHYFYRSHQMTAN